MVSSYRASSEALHGKSKEEEGLFLKSKDKIHAGGSYKDKLLNLFEEVASHKISEQSIASFVSVDTMVSRVDLDQLKEIEEGAGVEIPLSDEEWMQWSRPLQKTLVVEAMGKNLNFKALENNLHKKWPQKGNIRAVDMSDGCFLVYFSPEECMLSTKGCGWLQTTIS